MISSHKRSCYIFRYMSPSLLHPACCPSNKTLEMDKTRALKNNILFESKGEDGLLEVEHKSGLVEKEDCQCFPLLPMVTLQHCGKSFHASLNFSCGPSYGHNHKKQSPLFTTISGPASPTVVDACKRNVTTSNSNQNAILSESKSKSKHLTKSITLFLSLQNKVIIQELSC